MSQLESHSKEAIEAIKILKSFTPEYFKSLSECYSIRETDSIELIGLSNSLKNLPQFVNKLKAECLEAGKLLGLLL